MIDLKRLGAGQQLLRDTSLLNKNSSAYKRLSESDIQAFQQNLGYQPINSIVPLLPKMQMKPR